MCLCRVSKLTQSYNIAAWTQSLILLPRQKRQVKPLELRSTQSPEDRDESQVRVLWHAISVWNELCETQISRNFFSNPWKVSGLEWALMLSGPLPKARARTTLTISGHWNFYHSWEEGDGHRIKTTVWPVGVLGAWARNIWASFKVGRVTDRFKGSWIHDRKATSQRSTCIYLLNLHLGRADRAQHVPIPHYL